MTDSKEILAAAHKRIDCLEALVKVAFDKIDDQIKAYEDSRITLEGEAAEWGC